MLINLSNHPSANWSDEQKKAAIEQYNEIVDIAFPQIEPAASIEDVLQLVEQYVEKIIETIGYVNVHTFDYYSNAVHVMGEMTFTYNVLRELDRKGIDCVASTTERQVIVEQNGQKTSVFKFVQFRPYWDSDTLPF